MLIFYLTGKYIDGRCAEELCNEQVHGIIVYVLGFADLLYDTVLHHDDHIGDAHGFVLIVGNEDGGDLRLLLDPADLFSGLETESGIQIGEGLVQKKNARQLD